MYRIVPILMMAMLGACTNISTPKASGITPEAVGYLPPQPVMMSEQHLAGVWQLNDSPIDGVKPLMLQFGGGQVSVLNGCNHLSASYTIANHQLSIASPISTRMLCEPSLMAVDKLADELLAGKPTLHDVAGRVYLDIDVGGRSHRLTKVK